MKGGWRTRGQDVPGPINCTRQSPSFSRFALYTYIYISAVIFFRYWNRCFPSGRFSAIDRPETLPTPSLNHVFPRLFHACECTSILRLRIPIFGFFSFDLRDTDVSLMNFCNECVSTLDDTPTILIRENNCWESIRAQVTVLNYYKEGIRYFLRWASGFIYLLGTILIGINAWALTVNTVSLWTLCIPRGATLPSAFPAEDRESVRNRATTTTTVVYRSTIGKNATWHAWIFPFSLTEKVTWQSTILSFCSIVIF